MIGFDQVGQRSKAGLIALVFATIAGTFAAADVALAEPLFPGQPSYSPSLNPSAPYLLPPVQSPLLFREPPTLTSRYGFQQNAVLPFIGLGFQGGETGDVTRQAWRQSMLNAQLKSPNLFQQTLVPNEFQAGLRIPF